MLGLCKKKLVIFSVPKTGTSALDVAIAPFADQTFLAPPTMKHMPVYRYNRFMQPLMEIIGKPDLEKFAMIREPISWLGSWYRYRQREDLKGTPNSTLDVSFDELVNENLKGKSAPFANVGSQIGFFNGGVGPSGVDHLFKYENQAGAIAFLKDRLGIDINPPKAINASPEMELSLSSKVESKLRRKREDEFLLWDQAQ